MTEELYMTVMLWLMWVLIPAGALAGMIFSVRDDSFLKDPLNEVAVNLR